MASRSRVVMEKQDGSLLLKVLDCPFIEREAADVIVNLVSPTLHLHGRKLSSAIGTAAGPGLQRALFAESPKVGDVLVTLGFGLPCRYVYHVVTTGYHTDDAEQMMEESVLRCLRMANTNRMSSIAIPPLGTGGLGFSPDVVAQRMLRAVARYHKRAGTSPALREVRFALMETSVRVAFIRQLSEVTTDIPASPTKERSTKPGKDSEPAQAQGKHAVRGKRELVARKTSVTEESHLSFGPESHGQGTVDESTRLVRNGRPVDSATNSTTVDPTVISLVKEEYLRNHSMLSNDPFIPWCWTGMLGPGLRPRESEWLDALQEDLFMIRPRSPIIIHGAPAIGRSRFLNQIQELWVQGSLPKFKCVLRVSAFAILQVGSLRDVLWNHLVQEVGVPASKAAELLKEHNQSLLIMVDDADLLTNSVLLQTINEPDLMDMNFVFAVRTPDAPRIARLLNPSDIVELKGFSAMEVERYISMALGDSEDTQYLISQLRSDVNMPLCRIPGNLKRLCDICKETPDVNFQGRLQSLLSSWLKFETLKPKEKISAKKTKKTKFSAKQLPHNHSQSWHDRLEKENWALGKVYYDYFTTETKPLMPYWLNAITGADGKVVRPALDYAIAKHLAKLVNEGSLSACDSLETCYRLQTSLQLACGFSQTVSSTIQTHVLKLAKSDPKVQMARENVLDLEDDDGAMILNLLADLEAGCRRESRTKIVKDVPVELQHLGPEYVLAYQRACEEGSQAIYRTRVMIVGHFRAGKTSLKRRLMNKPFLAEYNTTNGIEADPSACKVNIDNTSNWNINNQGDEADKEEYSKAVAKLLHQLMQRLRPARVRSGLPQSPELDLAKVGKMLIKLGDSMQEELKSKPNLMSFMKGAFGMLGKTKDVVDPDIQTVEKEAVTPDDLLMAEVPPEVLRQLCGLMESVEKGEQPSKAEIKLSFWDFAGQTVFYTTHQTFLTHRAVYLLVLDLTLPLEAPICTYRQGRHGQVLDKTCPQTVADYLDYWLNCIHTHATSRELNPTAITLSPPVIIVGTHKDEIKKQYPDSAGQRIEEFYATVHKYIERKGYFEHVHLQFFAVANNWDDDAEVDKLRQTVISLAQEQAYWGEEIPLKWLDLRDRLRARRKAGASVIDLQSASAMATEAGITDQEDLCTVLKFYHELGDLVFFNEPNLKDFIVLDPQWLIDCFRKVITVNRFHEQHEFPESRRHWRRLEEEGVLHDNILDHVWDEGLKNQLLTLMFKFRLLLPLPSSQLTSDMLEESRTCPEVSYLVPCLLPPMEDLPEPMPSLPPVLVIFKDDFLPVGVTSRLVSGLVTDEGWTLSGQVFHNHATFLPGGPEAKVGLSLYQRPGHLEVSGLLLGDEEADAEGDTPQAVLRPYLMALLQQLQAVLLTVCPTVKFMLAVWCPCRHEPYMRKAVWIGPKGELLEGKNKLYCATHWKSFSTAPFSPWLKVAAPPKLTREESIKEFPTDSMLLRLSEEIGAEWFPLAISLNLTNQQAQRARIAHPYDHVQCVLSLLCTWRSHSQHDAPGKLKELRTALESSVVGRNDLAEDLVSKW